MSEASEKWLADSRAWLDEQMAAQQAQDDAAYVRFRAALLPFD